MSERINSLNLKRQSSQKIAGFYPPPVAKATPEWTVEVFSASYSPERWRRHRYAADLSYVKRGLQTIRNCHAAVQENYPIFFAEATQGGTIIGGVSIFLPDSFEHLPILEWLNGYADTALLEYHINKLSSKGIVQCGGLWTDPEQGNKEAAGDIARSFLAIVMALKVRYSILTCPLQTLGPWCSLGCELVSDFSSFPYPDERYQSYIILNDISYLKPDLAKWAFEQSKGKTLDGPGARFSIQAMRSATGNHEINLEKELINEV